MTCWAESEVQLADLELIDPISNRDVGMPVELINKAGLKPGDRVKYHVNSNGQIVIERHEARILKIRRGVARLLGVGA